MYYVHKNNIRCNFQLFNNFLQAVWYLYVFFWETIGLLVYCFPFEIGNIASANSVSVANILNGKKSNIYGTYHILEGFL